jgi:Iap family predicted aminopeptidase
MGYGAARRGDAYRPNAWSCVWSALDAVEVEVPETPKWPTLTLHDMPHYLGRLL